MLYIYIFSYQESIFETIFPTLFHQFSIVDSYASTHLQSLPTKLILVSTLKAVDMSTFIVMLLIDNYPFGVSRCSPFRKR